MGVMSCYRKGCDNIMCDTYINDIGYICYECKKEFMVINGNGKMLESKIIKRLTKFMTTTKKGDFQPEEPDGITISDFFEQFSR